MLIKQYNDEPAGEQIASIADFTCRTFGESAWRAHQNITTLVSEVDNITHLKS